MVTVMVGPEGSVENQGASPNSSQRADAKERANPRQGLIMTRALGGIISERETELQMKRNETTANERK